MVYFYVMSITLAVFLFFYSGSYCLSTKVPIVCFPLSQ
jgi:hypothetical protein